MLVKFKILSLARSIISNLPFAHSNNRPEEPTTSSKHEESRFNKVKAISSEQYFERDRDTSGSDRYRLDRFSGSASISSDDYFDRPQKVPMGFIAVMNSPNFSDVRDYVKDNVKNVAESLSSYATSVMRRMNTDDEY